MRFEAPWAFLLLLLIPVLLYLHFRKQKPTMVFASVAIPKMTKASLRRQLVYFPLFLRVVALILLIIGLARPQEGMEKVYDVNKGIAIEMVVDRSSSMGAEMVMDGRRGNRLEVVKRVFAEFVDGNNKELAGRPNDLVGMVTFARYADTVCPLTLAHGPLKTFLGNVSLVDQKSEDGTGIGDALMLAAARLKTAEETLARQALEKETVYEIKSKIIILLTDGQNNVGQFSPEQAAAQAKEWGIKIYCIGVGEEQPRGRSIFGMNILPGGGVDKALLQGISETTEGLFRMASNAKALREVYQEIDRLEKSEVESVRFIDYREYFTPFILWALALLCLEILFNNTVFRKLP